MRQMIQNFRTGKLQVEEVPIPHLKDYGVLVKNHYSLVSAGTEKAVIEFAKQSLAGKAKRRPDLVKEVLNKIKTEGILSTYKAALNRLDTPLPLGYSCAGEIIGVGKKVEGINRGDLVACGGIGYASHAEVVFVPKNLCVNIPDNISTKEASFVTLGAIAMQGVRVADRTPGEKVAVIGLGLVGQLTIQILNAYGFSVFGLDVNKKQIEKAFDLGLKHGAVIGEDDINKIVDSFTNRVGVDGVIITAATKSSEPVELAGRICRDKGKVSIVGDIGMNIPRNIYYEKEIDLAVSRSYGPGRYDPNYEEKGLDYPIGYARWTEKRNMEEFLRLISIERVDVKPMITHTFKIEDALMAYNLILENPDKEEFTGVLLEYNPAKEHKPTIEISKVKKETVQKDVLNAGLIGSGNFAHNVILPCIKKIKYLNLKAIVDAKGERAKRAANKYKCEYVTSDYNTVLNDENIDLVIISTRHDLHVQIAIQALKKDKNVHLEKPMALNMKQLKELVKAESASKGRLMVGFNRRFAPHVIETKKLLTDTQTPMLIYYRVNAGYIPKEHWVHDLEEGGGRIIGEVCHFVDLFQFLTNSAPEKVYATKISAKEPVIESDNVEIMIDFSNGSRGSILYTSLGSKAASKEYIEIFTDDTVAIIDNFKSGKFFRKNRLKKLRRFNLDKGHHKEFETFTKAILNGEPAPISMEEQILATLVTFKILESLEKKEPVEINLSEVFKEKI
jgi:predicted dehydrogenase/threonine dehydrogenase-like Zn-dependent dehydrogenase